MTMDLMHLEDFLDARAVVATREANRHLSEKARHEDEAERNKEVAVYCERAAVRIRGLREYLMQAPSGIAIEISAMVKADPAPEPAPVDEPTADPVAGGDDGAKGTAPVAPAEAGPVRDDPVPADTAVADPVPAAGDDVPADAEVGDDRGAEGSGAGEAGAEANAEDPHEAARAAIRALIGERNDKTDMLKSALATIPGKPKKLSSVSVEYLAGLVDLIKSDLARLECAPAEDTAPKQPAQSPMEERLVPRLTVTPEAEGLTEYDQRFLDVMRMNLDRNGLCKLKPFDICEIADLNKATAGSCISRLIKARRIVHSSGGAYRVSDKGGSFPPMQKAETPAVPPARPKVVSALADRFLQKFADVAAKKNTDTVMFGREFLIEFAGAAKGDFLPVDHALAELGSRRAIEVTHRDKMNVTVRVLPIAEAAE